jgi:hypothetical protein
MLQPAHALHRYVEGKPEHLPACAAHSATTVRESTAGRGYGDNAASIEPL